jgi:hypothetical protein
MTPDVVDCGVKIAFIVRIAVDYLDMLLYRGRVVFQMRERRDHVLSKLCDLSASLPRIFVLFLQCLDGGSKRRP